MSEKKRNCVYVGSFNPVHIGHLDAIEEGLRRFEYVNVFVRYNEGVDLTNWETKKMWFDRLNEEKYDNRLRIFKEESEEKGKKYGIELFFDFIRKTEKIVGEPIDGFLFGDDYNKIKSALQTEFPDKEFMITERGNGYSSTAVREDLEGHKDWLPYYVYDSLKSLQEG